MRSLTVHLRSIGIGVWLSVVYVVLFFVSIIVRGKDGGLSLFWLPTAFAAPALARTKLRHWPIVVACLCVANILANKYSDRSILDSLLFTIEDIGIPILAAMMIRRLLDPVEPLRTRRDAVFLFLIATLASVLSATLGSVVFAAHKPDFLSGGFWAGWWTWVTAIFIGFCVAAPLSLTLPVRRPVRFRIRRALSTLIPVVVLLFVTRHVFAYEPVDGFVHPLLFAPIPLLIWASLQGGIAGASWGIFVVGIVGAMQFSGGRGPMVIHGSNPLTGVVWLQMYFGTLSLSTVLLGTVVEEFRANLAGRSAQRQALEMIALGKPLDHILEQGVRLTDDALPQCVGCVYLVDEISRTLRLVSKTRFAEGFNTFIEYIRIAPDSSAAGAAAHRRERLIVTDALTDPLLGKDPLQLRALGIGAIFSQPITSSTDELFGVSVMFCSDSRQPTATELRFLESGAYFAGVAIERARAIDSLRDARDAAQKANLAKDRFLAVLSHELRTPLTPVLLYASSLEQQADLPPAAREELKIIREQVEHESALIDDLLDLTRIERGKFHLSPRSIDLSEIIRRVVKAHADPFKQGKLTLQQELSALDHRLHADPARVQQLFSNLIGNAIKFSPPGGEITLVTRSEGEFLVTEIVDNGIGIDPLVMPRLFKPFEQGEQSITRRFGGLGLGLVISKSIAELHGGSLTAFSEGVGRGTSIVVRLPRVAVAGAVAEKPSDPSRPDVHVSILLVEDHATTRDALAGLLRDAGHVVYTATNVAEAKLSAAEFPFEVLVCDIGLPDGNGLDVVTHIRQLKRVVAIAISGYGSEDDLRRSNDAGFHEHLIKPITLDTLQASINRHVAAVRNQG